MYVCEYIYSFNTSFEISIDVTCGRLIERVSTVAAYIHTWIDLSVL